MASIIKTAVQLIPLVVEGMQLLRRITVRRRPEKSKWGKLHHWVYYEPGTGSVTVPRAVPVCFHCHDPLTRESENAICPGPPGWK